MIVVQVHVRLGTVDGEPMVLVLSEDDMKAFETSLNDVPWDAGRVYDSRLELSVSEAGGVVQSVKILSEAPEVLVIEASEDEEAESVPG